MQTPLGSHITHLEQVIKILADRLATDSGLDGPERTRYLAELRTAQLALLHYRHAYDLERSVA